MQLDNRTKHLLRELGRAINEAVSDSDRIAEIIARIKASGYDVFLMLDAVVALNRQATADDGESFAASDDQRFLKSLKIRINGERRTPADTPDGGKGFEITPQDLKFLKSLKINVDDLS